MWGSVRRFLLGGLKGALLKSVDELDALEPKIKRLIEEKGPGAAVAIVDQVQDWLRGVIDRSL